MTGEMIPAGYLAKKILPRPDWVTNQQVEEVITLSHCMAKDFARYIDYWQHNGHWLFDSPEKIQNLATEQKIDLNGFRYFYYEIYSLQYKEDPKNWSAYKHDDFPTQVVVPKEKAWRGFDVVNYYCRSTPECSPLSCNNLAADLPVNRYCLLDSLQQAKKLLETGTFDNSEPGPFRMVAVWEVTPEKSA